MLVKFYVIRYRDTVVPKIIIYIKRSASGCTYYVLVFALDSRPARGILFARIKRENKHAVCSTTLISVTDDTCMSIAWPSQLFNKVNS